MLGAPVAAYHLHLLELIRQLSADRGLDDYAALDPQLDPGQRLMQAISAAKRRYEASPEASRGLEPATAIRYVARAHILSAGMFAIGLDHRLWSMLPSLAPLRPRVAVDRRDREGGGDGGTTRRGPS